MSVSQFKDFAPTFGGCEAKAMAKLSGEYKEPFNKAFLEGSFVHAWNEGKLEEFKADNPEVYSSRGANKGQLKAEYQHCETMITRLEGDALVMQALAGQKEVIFTAELFGMPWKAMIDSYNPEKGYFTDLKTIKEIGGKYWNKEGYYENFVDHYGYHVQMAVYAEIERITSGRSPEDWLIPHIVVVSKQDPPDIDVIYFDHNSIEHGLSIVRESIGRIKQVKDGDKPIRCEKCAYCRGTKKILKIKHYSQINT